MNASEHFLRYAADCEQSRRLPAKAWGARPAVCALPDQEGTLSMIIGNALNVACLRGKSYRTEMHGEPTVAFFGCQDD
jgi:hypothetical protein